MTMWMRKDRNKLDNWHFLTRHQRSDHKMVLKVIMSYLEINEQGKFQERNWKDKKVEIIKLKK